MFTIFRAVNGSLNHAMPISATSAVPAPDQIAYDESIGEMRGRA
jgi:hypothetical protein